MTDFFRQLLFTIHLFGYSVPVTAWTLFGLIGNVLFTSRVFSQWLASERAGRSVVPVSFWWLSLVASLILIIYAFGRQDIPFILGLAVTLVPYIRNLAIHYRPHRPPRKLGPVLAIAVVLFCVPVGVYWHRSGDAPWGLWFWVGMVGNAVFMSRFFVAWIASERRREATLPLGFWWLSLVGSMILLIYSLQRRDLVFIFSFLFNGIPYGRNIVLIRRENRARPTLPPAAEPAR